MKNPSMVQAIGVCGLIFGALVQVGSAAEVTARIQSAQGQVKVLSGNAWQAAQVGQELAVGATIRTGPNSSAVVIPSRGTEVNVGANTEFRVEDVNQTNTKSRTQIQLRSGKVTAFINPKYSNLTDFRIRTPAGVAAARGTVYEVAVDGDKTSVAVDRGQVGFDFTSAK